MQNSINLKELLLNLQLLIKEEKFEEALKIYQEIEKNWHIFEKHKISTQELQELLNIVSFLDKILFTKKQNCLERQKCLNVQKVYSKY